MKGLFLTMLMLTGSLYAAPECVFKVYTLADGGRVKSYPMVQNKEFAKENILKLEAETSELYASMGEMGNNEYLISISFNPANQEGLMTTSGFAGNVLRSSLMYDDISATVECYKEAKSK